VLDPQRRREMEAIAMLLGATLLATVVAALRFA
jgi:hypothetical protein